MILLSKIIVYLFKIYLLKSMLVTKGGDRRSLHGSQENVSKSNKNKFNLIYIFSEISKIQINSKLICLN